MNRDTSAKLAEKLSLATERSIIFYIYDLPTIAFIATSKMSEPVIVIPKYDFRQPEKVQLLL